MNVILFRGMPGVGKTAITDSLALETGLLVLRKDDVYDNVAENLKSHELSNRVSYKFLYKFIETNKNSDQTLLLDYPFKDGWINVLVDKCNKLDVGLRTVLVTCSDKDLWRKRFHNRSMNPALNQLITDLDELKNFYGSLEVQRLPEEIVVDTKEELDIITTFLIESLNLSR